MMEKLSVEVARDSPKGSADEDSVFYHKDAAHKETAHEAAERGHAATDKYVALSRFRLDTRSRLPLFQVRPLARTI